MTGEYDGDGNDPQDKIDNIILWVLLIVGFFAVMAFVFIYK